MHLISDTNVWVDFQTIQGLALPFRLSHNFYSSTDVIKDELLVPVGINIKLIELGLIPLEVSEVEYFAVPHIMASHPRLSRYDALALSIAKERGFALLTGDKALRKAGEAAGVKIKGTLWIFDELKRQDCITDSDFHRYIVALRDYNGKSIRLPASEINKRLEQFRN